MNKEEYLKEMMELKSGNVSAFSKYANVPYTTIRSILERGIENAKVQNVIDICKGLGITVESLVGFESSTISETSKIMIQLEKSRQTSTYRFASQQLDEQKSNVVEFSNKHIEIEIKGYVSAGRGEYLSDDARETVTISGPVPSDYDFAVKVNGDSMQPLLSDKQVIFIKKLVDCDDVRNNQIVIAKIGSDAYVKKISIDSKGIKLISLNKEYADINVTDVEDFKVFGTVII